VSVPKILITGPAKTDLDAQTTTRDRPRLWIAGVEIIMPCQTLPQATRSLEFLQALGELARYQRHRLREHVEVLRPTPILQRPETATDEEFEAAIAREYAEPPRYMVFDHDTNGPERPRTVWPWGSDLITHYNTDGDEAASLPVEPATVVQAAIRASAFGPIVSHHGTNDLGEGPQPAPV
jgi:hypothetical protein